MIGNFFPKPERRREEIPFPEDFPFNIYQARGTHKKLSYLHRHNFLEINYVSGGRGTNFIDHQSWPLSPGNLFLINNRQDHMAVTDGSLRMTIITLTPDLLGGNDPADKPPLWNNRNFRQISEIPRQEF